MACALLLIVLALATQIFLPVVRTYAKHDQHTVLQQRVSTAMERLEAEVSDTNVRGLNFLTAPQRALIIQPLGAPGATGAAFWSPELRVCAASNQELRLHVWRSKALTQHTISRPYAIVANEFGSILTTTPGASQLLCSGLLDFEVKGLENETRRLPLQLKISARLSGGEQLELYRQISPRSAVSR